MCQDEVLSSGQELHSTLTCLAGVADISRHIGDGKPFSDLPPKGLGPARSIAVALSLSMPLWAIIGFASWALSSSHPG